MPDTSTTCEGVKATAHCCPTEVSSWDVRLVEHVDPMEWEYHESTIITLAAIATHIRDTVLASTSPIVVSSTLTYTMAMRWIPSLAHGIQDLR